MKYIILCLSIFLISCQGLQYSVVPPRSSANISKHESPSNQVQRQLEQPYVSSYGEVPAEDHLTVYKWINYFQNKGREHIEKYLSRSTRYIPMMKQVLREYELPEDLVYVPMIESGFNPRAHSTASAVGYWQFIEGTGRRYGLKINSYVDERRDPVLSTRSAAAYLKNLYNTFESWHLALASYNAGEYRIGRLILNYSTRNFWFLAKQSAFPKETANYIPKLIAVIRIAKDPEKYGFTDIIYQAPMEYDTVQISHPISLKKLAANINIDYEQLQHLNPRYRGEYVPLDTSEGTTLRVPVGMKEQTTAIIAQSKMKQPKYSISNHFQYRVRKGDTLSSLAHRHRTSVSAIRRLNKMSKSDTLYAGKKIKIPYYNSQRKSRLAKKHVVKPGESLHRIANKYNVNISSLKKLNNLGSTVIHPGQVLRLTNSTSKHASHRGAKRTRTKSSHKIHTVKRGDTMIGIAKAYNVPLMTLIRLNALTFKSTIKVDRQIIIPK